MIQSGQPSKPKTVLYSVFPNHELYTEKYFSLIHLDLYENTLKKKRF